jgi:hypothetical protein
VQKTESCSGIGGINQQDNALQETMGPIVDRSRELLCPADKVIIQARKLLREAVKDVEAGRPAPAQLLHGQGRRRRLRARCRLALGAAA